MTAKNIPVPLLSRPLTVDQLFSTKGQETLLRLLARIFFDESLFLKPYVHPSGTSIRGREGIAWMDSHLLSLHFLILFFSVFIFYIFTMYNIFSLREHMHPLSIYCHLIFYLKKRTL